MGAMRLTTTILFLFSVGAMAEDLSTAVNAWTDGPFLSFTGDSIAEGHYLYHSIQHTGPSGDTNADIANVVFNTSTNIATGTNYGHGGTTFATILSGDVSPALSVRPKYLIIHCGVNDVSVGRTWGQVETDLNSIKSLCVASNAIMVLDDIFPWNNGTDANALTVRTWNTNLTAWSATNGVKRILSHDAMGQTRVSTGYKDDIISAYNTDGVHINTNGYAQWARIIVTNLVQWETHRVWRVNSATVSNMK